MTEAEPKKPIFIRSKRRANRRHLSRMVGKESWQSEYERLNKEPIVNDISGDFMYSKRRPIVASGAKRPARQPQPEPPVKKSRAVVTGRNEEQAWLQGQKRLRQQEEEHSFDELPYDDVPDVPHERFSRLEELVDTNPGVDLTVVHEGQYCLIFDGELYVSDHLEDIEAAVEKIMVSDQSVNPDSLVVVKRLSMKVGVSIG